MSTSTLRRLLTLAASLCLLSLCRPALAQDLEMGARATGTPFTVAWADTGQGLQLDPDRAKDVADQFAGVDWGFFTNGQLIIGKNAEPILTLFYITNEARTFFLFHRRERTYQVDGLALRDAADKTGLAEFYITTVAEDGSASSTVFVRTDLSFTR
jgi:hypothetical protein